MSFSHSIFISELVKLTGSKTYLELGVYDAETFNRVVPLVVRAVGVDIVDVRTTKIGEFFKGTTQEFFKQNSSTFDTIFIDASHKFEDVKFDFNKTIDILNKNGTILIHDTDPMSLEYLQDGYCSDSYRIIPYIRRDFSETDILTIPINECGMSIIRRKSDRRVNNFLGTNL